MQCFKTRQLSVFPQQRRCRNQKDLDLKIHKKNIRGGRKLFFCKGKASLRILSAANKILTYGREMCFISLSNSQENFMCLGKSGLLFFITIAVELLMKIRLAGL